MEDHKPIESSTQPNIRRKKILIIDDELLIRKQLSRKLSRSGYEIIEADQVDKGFQIAQEKYPDLIITDYSTPGRMNGLDLIEQITRIPVILMSGTKHIPEEAARLGARFGLYKPIQVKEMLDAVSFCIGNG